MYSNFRSKYCQTSNIIHILVCNKIVDHSDVVGASPVGAAPTTSSFLTPHLASMVWAKSTARQEDQNHLNFGMWCMLYQRFYGGNVMYKESSHNVLFSMTSRQDVSDPCWQLALKLHLKCSSSEHVFKFQIKVAVKDTTLHKHKSNCGQPVNTSPPGQNGRHFAWYFQMHFREWKVLYFD